MGTPGIVNDYTKVHKSSCNHRMFPSQLVSAVVQSFTHQSQTLNFFDCFSIITTKPKRVQYRAQILQENINCLIYMASSSPFEPNIKITNLQNAGCQTDSPNSTPPHASRFQSPLDRSTYPTTPVIAFGPAG